MAAELKIYTSQTPDSDRIEALMKARQANVATLAAYLSNLITTLPATIDDGFIGEKLDTIEIKINEALEKNSSLSLQYGKQHFSYTQNRHQGLGMFSSWWHKSWYQSRANVCLEHTLSTLDAFKTSFAKKAPATPSNV